jgi:hypothetical protein
MATPDRRFRGLVERLLSTAGPQDAARLATYGIKYVYAPAPVSDAVSGGFDAAGGFGSSGAPGAADRAWVVQARPTLTSLDRDRDWLRPIWVTVDLVALLTSLVLAAPERRRR